MTPEGYPENDIGCLSGPKKTKEKGSTNGSTFTPLYNGIEDSYGVDSIGYCWVIGDLKGNITLVRVSTFFPCQTLVRIIMHQVLMLEQLVQ